MAGKHKNFVSVLLSDEQIEKVELLLKHYYIRDKKMPHKSVLFRDIIMDRVEILLNEIYGSSGIDGIDKDIEQPVNNIPVTQDTKPDIILAITFGDILSTLTD